MRTGTIAAAVLALAAAGCGGTTAPASTGDTPASLMRVPVGTSPVQGPSDAWVTVVEYSDFQCPYCGAVQPTLAQVLPGYGSDVRLVFKNFPLAIHSFATRTAVAAECAHVQGRFWEFHDLVFANQGTLFDSGYETDLAAYAAQAGLDVAAWQACRTDGAAEARVVADEQLGVQLGVGGTPTFVVNGVPLVGAQPAAAFRVAIDQALARAKASGIPAADYYDKAVLGL